MSRIQELDLCVEEFKLPQLKIKEKKIDQSVRKVSTECYPSNVPPTSRSTDATVPDVPAGLLLLPR